MDYREHRRNVDNSSQTTASNNNQSSTTTTTNNNNNLRRRNSSTRRGGSPFSLRSGASAAVHNASSSSRNRSSPSLKARLRLNRSQQQHHQAATTAHHPKSTSPLTCSGLASYQPIQNFTELRTLPLTYELAFYVAVESSKDVKDNWDAVVKYYATTLKTVQPSDSLGQHAQLLYKSTQGHFDRLAKVVESVKEQRHNELPSFDPQHFIPIYNFYKHEKPRFYEVLQAEAKIQRWSAYDNVLDTCSPSFYDCKLFNRYVMTDALTSLVLDAAFNGRVCELPKCIFMASNLERLSLRENNLRSVPADIGRLDKLKCLELSHNRLKNDSIPYTLSFCTEITTLFLDYNALDAVPGFVLKLTKLKTLHRHGNQNYFRSTFMWYGCESRERIRTASFADIDVAITALSCVSNVQSAMFWAARTIISTKTNYFHLEGISETVKDYISNVYKLFNICAACRTANLLNSQGYLVFTFHNPFVGNTCVPFQHWTCSKECALAIEIPARKEQVLMAKRQQHDYDSHVRLYSRQPNTIHEHTPIPSTTNTANLLCPTCHPERRKRRKRLRCRVM